MNAEGWVLAGAGACGWDEDKAGVALAGRPLLDTCWTSCGRWGAGARGGAARADRGCMTAEVFTDAHPDCGPLSGMETALGEERGRAGDGAGGRSAVAGRRSFWHGCCERAATTGAMATIPRLRVSRSRCARSTAASCCRDNRGAASRRLQSDGCGGARGCQDRGGGIDCFRRQRELRRPARGARRGPRTGSS